MLTRKTGSTLAPRRCAAESSSLRDRALTNRGFSSGKIPLGHRYFLLIPLGQVRRGPTSAIEREGRQGSLGGRRQLSETRR